MTAASRLDAGKMQEAMYRQENIRNISVIAHVDHGKSTLTDALVSRAGLLAENQSGERRFTDIGDDEKARGITIKSTAVSMFFEMKNEALLGNLKRDGNAFLVNLIDSPGHVDFNAEVTAALRVTDGAIVVVDVVSGVSVQTETVLRQALSERITPVLIINKIDRAILEQVLEPETLYRRFKEIIDKVNYLLYVYSGGDEEEVENVEEKVEVASDDVEAKPVVREEKFRCAKLDPLKGNVAFAAGKDGWAFTLTQFADMYFKKNGKSVLDRLWNDNFFNPETKKFEKNAISKSGVVLKRGFVQYVLEPVYSALDICGKNDFVKLEHICKTLSIDYHLNTEKQDKLLQSGGRALMKDFMRKWLPAADAMLELIVVHLPSPVTAQRYRVGGLYEGPLDDDAAMAIRTCSADGPLMIYISKMMPDPMDQRKFFAFGRIFSGTAETGLNVRIMSPEYEPGSENGLFMKKLTRCVCMIGGDALAFDTVPCGNIVALSGIDKLLMKCGTISTYPHAHNIKSMKFSVSPVVRIAAEPVNPADLVKFIEGLKILSRSDQLVQCKVEQGKHIIYGAGELHLEICMRDLEQKYAKVPIRTSEPLVTYKETVAKRSEQVCLAKSANKLNRIYLTAEPLTDEFCVDVDNGKLSINQDAKERAKYLQTNHKFDSTDAKKIWCFGPNQFDSNILVDMTKGVASSGDVKDTICAGFQWGSAEGVLCQENLRGVRFNLEDLSYHADAAHRKGVQLIPTIRRAMMAAMISAGPRLLEPVYLVDITAPESVSGAVYTLLNKKRGIILEKDFIEGTLLYSIKAHLPVNESNGFTEELRGVTSGKAFPQCSFSHWQLLPGDPFDVASQAGKVAAEIRKMKGMKNELPLLAEYLDKL